MSNIRTAPHILKLQKQYKHLLISDLDIRIFKIKSANAKIKHERIKICKD